jgi:hypothetical protein
MYGFIIGLSFRESSFAVLAGGIFGFFVFYYITDLFLVYVRHLKPVVVYVTPYRTRLRYRDWRTRRQEKSKNKKVFTRRNKFFVRVRKTYGMWGIIILIPFALSIPVGAFLLRKYYGHRKEAIPAALIVLVFEGMIISGISWFVYGNH